jgi:hypothetical protein
MIMLDRDHLGVLDMRCERNAFGRQVRSFEGDVELDGFASPFTPSSSGRRGWPSTPRRSRARRGRRAPDRGRLPAGSWRSPSTPSCPATTRLHRWLLEQL